MDELTYEEQLKLDNSKEHLKVVLRNVRIANEDLGLVLIALDAGRDKLKEVVEQRYEISISNSKALAEIAELKSAQDRREISLLERENKIDIKEKDLEDKIIKSEDVLKDVIKNISIFRSQHDDAIRHHNEKIDELKRNISSLEEQTKQNEEIIKEKLLIAQNIENEITRLSSEAEEAKKNLDRFNLTSKKEMEETNNLIQEEKGKIKNPLDLIRRESEKLEVTRKDFATLRARLIKQFKEQNPEKILPLELQEKDGE